MQLIPQKSAQFNLFKECRLLHTELTCVVSPEGNNTKHDDNPTTGAKVGSVTTRLHVASSSSAATKQSEPKGQTLCQLCLNMSVSPSGKVPSLCEYRAADAAIQKSVENMTQLAPPQQQQQKQQTSIQFEFYFTSTKILETICMYVCSRTYPHLYRDILFVVKKQIYTYKYIYTI